MGACDAKSGAPDPTVNLMTASGTIATDYSNGSYRPKADMPNMIEIYCISNISYSNKEVFNDVIFQNPYISG